MDVQKTIEELQKKLYTVTYFKTYQEVADYLDQEIDGKVVGFGDSRTMIEWY